MPNGMRGVRVRPPSSTPRRKVQLSQQKKPPAPKKAVVSVAAAHKLDPPAQRWVNLLRDPCNADLTRPCYGGTSSGYLVRTSTIVGVPGTSVDGIFEFTPSCSDTSAILRYGWSNTVGGGLGNASKGVYPGFIASSTVGRYRPVAGCARVHYIGTELNRSGIIGLNLSAGQILVDGEVIGATIPQILPNCAIKTRTSDRPLEIRWAPNHADGTFITNSIGSDEQSNTIMENLGNSIVVAWSGVPASSIQIEYVFIWEWQPAGEANIGLMTTAGSPASKNHLNEILSVLGDMGKFALGKVAQYGPYVLEQAVKMI